MAGQPSRMVADDRPLWMLSKDEIFDRAFPVPETGTRQPQPEPAPGTSGGLAGPPLTQVPDGSVPVAAGPPPARLPSVVSPDQASPAAPLAPSAAAPLATPSQVSAPAVPSSPSVTEGVASPSSPTGSTSGAVTAGAKPGAARFSGRLRLEEKNRDEDYPAQGLHLPNDNHVQRLTLQYQLDPKSLVSLEGRHLQRKRNEVVNEDYLTFNLLHTHSRQAAFVFKDVFSRIRYPDSPVKDYDHNLATVVWNKKEGKWERLYSAGVENRKFPRFASADFNQVNYEYENTYFIPNGTLFGSVNWSGRSYSESPYLDYLQRGFGFDFNRAFAGNKSEITLNETYDSRLFGNESVNLFRTSYWDNFFSYKYDLPVSPTFNWTFEGIWQKRKYASDFGRGYGQVNLTTTVKIVEDKTSRGKVAHQYVHNDENTEGKAHKNHTLSGSWEKKFTDTFKVKVGDAIHQRWSVIGDVMDFRETDLTLQANKKLPANVEVTLVGQSLDRVYRNLYYADYKYWRAGLIGAYVRPKKFDVQVERYSRAFSHKNGNNLVTDWIEETQPSMAVKVSITLSKDLRLKLNYLQEETYYKGFDTVAQELLWDFNRPLHLREVNGSLDYDF
ncbi:MAG: hypothetical protein GX442_21880 [Candidatus Riflebacteria bacterium]|nr:hypothetical protein [Candidatus Riflebacteria bacterium]